MSPPLILVPACRLCVTQAAATTNSAQATGRQRRDGSRPSGNTRMRSNSSTTVSSAAAPARVPTNRAPGAEPRAVASPYSAYCSANVEVAIDTPIRPSSQPTALPGRRLVIRRPDAV